MLKRLLRHRKSTVLIVYSRPDCPLCQEAERVLKRKFGRRRLKVIDITSNASLEDEYLFRVPVVTFEGAIVAEGSVSERELTAIDTGIRTRSAIQEKSV